MSLIEISLWVSGAVIGAFTAVVVQRSRARLARERAELARLERKVYELKAAKAPPREVVLGYEVRREGKDMVIVFKRDGAVVEQYWMTDQAAAQLVSAIVAKFEA
jgi:hypothetical protein